ncbi:stage V sporulation protein AA [Velocimicrobium porci]|uniref:Stage V sporulation protein AA n=1 Tax=Velocimicrobium porci TaxID=2606634 RepID=A0A6L5XZ80_9FIRM|nr:stage V sporulation protein AA [Velocimicrobium porci]MSS63518.1 stage V sporulation protein AA [Velocimicrobium porci]
MKNSILYLKIEQSMDILNKRVYLEDIAKIMCNDKKAEHELNKTIFYTITAKEDTKYMFSVMKVIELIEKSHPELDVVNLGESDFVLNYKVPKEQKKTMEYCKVAFVSLTAFFGGAFSIMTFNTDVSVSEVFDKIYLLVMGQAKSSGSIVEIGYSLGLIVGILVFFNHFSNKQRHEDPTPIEVEMRIYEEDVNKALIKEAAREGKTIDAN